MTTRELDESPRREMFVVVSHGAQEELASVGMAFALRSLSAGMKTTVYLTSDGVDLARKNAVGTAHFPPFEPLGSMLRSFLSEGGTLWACHACTAARTYADDMLISEVAVVGADEMMRSVASGAATMNF